MCAYGAGEGYFQLNDPFAESETSQFFPVRIVLPLIHITSTTGENNAAMSLTEECLLVRD